MRLGPCPGGSWSLGPLWYHQPDPARALLRTGGGDYFVLGDDVLSYRTGYDGGTSGTLRRVR